jgi:putative ABC transport system permease protein
MARDVHFEAPMNVRYAIRLLIKSPGFALVAILTLALGIGVNSAIFSIVDAVMLRPLPYPEPERLVSLSEKAGKQGPDNVSTSGQPLGGGADSRMVVAPANLVDYQKQKHTFLGLAGFESSGMNLTGSGLPETLSGEAVTQNFFSVLGIAPAQGRAFLPSEDRPGADHVVILSDKFWRSHFGADPQILGRAITLNNEKYTVVGIMPPDFQTPRQIAMSSVVSYLVPAAYPEKLLANHADHRVLVVGRLRPGATLASAQAELSSISEGLAAQYPQSNKGLAADIVPLATEINFKARASLAILLGAVGLILLISCANLANLLLVRAIGRQREITIRFALGASRSRIIGDLLVQSAVLAIAGCGVGLLFGAWTQHFLVSLAPPNLPRLDTAALNPRVMLFTLALSLVTGIVFGLMPAWQASKARPAEAMRATDRNLAGSSVMRWRNLLMTAEIAVSMILLVGAGLLLKSFVTLNGVSLGITTERVLAMTIGLPDTRYGTPEKRNAFFEELTERVSHLPGVESAGYANRMPMRGGWSSNARIENHTNDGDADYQAVNPSYFATLGVKLQRGRLLTPADRNGSLPVAVVSEEFVRHYLPAEDPIGRRFRRGEGDPWINIVGVVSDIRRSGKDSILRPEVFFPAAQTASYNVRLSDFAFRASGNPKTLMTAVQQQVWAIDKDQPVTQVKTLEEVISQSVSERRFQTLLLGMFAALALILAMIGIYGVISYSVSQRIPEIGLRMALGASRGGILSMVIGRAMLLVAIGIVAGGAGAYSLSQYLKSVLFEVKPGDPITYATIAMLLSIVALAASFLPARRAMRVDPMIALRYE